MVDTYLKDLERENEKLRAALDEIGRQAMACWMDLQGHLVDDAHRKAHGMLGSIAKVAASVLPDE